MLYDMHLHLLEDHIMWLLIDHHTNIIVAQTLQEDIIHTIEEDKQY
jgi:hypothetical protein